VAALIRSPCRSRPSFEAVHAGLERAGDDPVTIVRFGQLATRLARSSRAPLRRAAEAIDAANALPVVTEQAAAASLAVGEAKAFGGEVAVEICNELFSASTTSSSKRSRDCSGRARSGGRGHARP
jgi:alkylation response protein AidB-like acyl-CoA dehydrogenase